MVQVERPLGSPTQVSEISVASGVGSAGARSGQTEVSAGTAEGEKNELFMEGRT